MSWPSLCISGSRHTNNAFIKAFFELGKWNIIMHSSAAIVSVKTVLSEWVSEWVSGWVSGYLTSPWSDPSRYWHKSGVNFPIFSSSSSIWKIDSLLVSVIFLLLWGLFLPVAIAAALSASSFASDARCLRLLSSYIMELMNAVALNSVWSYEVISLWVMNEWMGEWMNMSVSST